MRPDELDPGARPDPSALPAARARGPRPYPSRPPSPGEILAASRLIAVNQSSGSGDVLLLAIAGPVIAGTSLFGGRGSVWSALLGAVVIGSISNGMDLLGLDSDIKFMITGAVLLAAVVIDSLARRQRERVQVT